MNSHLILKAFQKAGVEVIKGRGKGSHCLLRKDGKQATLPMHGSKDVPKFLVIKICKQLGLDFDKVF